MKLTKKVYDYVFENEDRENFIVKTYPYYAENNKEDISYDNIWEVKLFTKYDNLINMFNYYIEEDYALEKVDELFNFNGNFELIKEVYEYKGYEVILHSLDKPTICVHINKDGIDKRGWTGVGCIEEGKYLAKEYIDNLEKESKKIYLDGNWYSYEEFIENIKKGLKENVNNKIVINGDIYGFKDFVKKVKEKLEENKSFKVCPYCCDVIDDDICKNNQHRCRNLK